MRESQIATIDVEGTQRLRHWPRVGRVNAGANTTVRHHVVRRRRARLPLDWGYVVRQAPPQRKFPAVAEHDGTAGHDAWRAP